MADESYPKTKEELRRALESDENIDGLSEGDWEQLEADGEVDHYLKSPSSAKYQQITTRLRPVDQPWTLGRTRGRTTTFPFNREVLRIEHKRAEAFAAALARRAARRADLVDLRKRLLGGRTLTVDQAVHFVRQAGLRELDSTWFLKEGIPIVNHRSYYFDPSSETEHLVPDDNSRLVFEWKGERRVFDPRTVDGRRPPHDLWTGDFGWFMTLNSHSVLGEIHVVISTLMKLYGWEGPETVAFILTGTPPPIPPVAAVRPWSRKGRRTDHHHNVITLQIEPWVSPDTVVRVYQRVQRKLTGRQARNLHETSIDIFNFVEKFLDKEFRCSWDDIKSKVDEKGKRVRIPWKTIADQWNKQKNDTYSAWDMRRKFDITYKEMIRRPFTPWTEREKERKGVQKKQDRATAPTRRSTPCVSARDRAGALTRKRVSKKRRQR